MRTVFLLLVSCSIMFTKAKGQYSVRLMISEVATKKQDNIYVAGSFNNWNPQDDKYKLKPFGTTRRGIVLDGLAAGRYDFKFTRGMDKWETTAKGEDIANREIVVGADTTLNCTVAGWKDDFPDKPKRNTATAQVHLLDTAFAIPQLNTTRRIWAYLPKDYATSKKRYPVIYMQDGQNLFNEQTAAFGEWGLDECLDTLIQQSGKGVIVIGIDNGLAKRMNEYNPYDHKEFGKGLGNEYVDFLANTLKPFIDKKYRTLKDSLNTFVAGSSMGGLISLYAVVKYPKVFGGAGIFSPAFWTAPALFDEVANAKLGTARKKFFFYAGGKENVDMVPDMDKMITIIERKSDYETSRVLFPLGKHNEANWQKAFPEFFDLSPADNQKYPMKRFAIFCLFFAGTSSYAQDSATARKWVDTLTSPYFWGRGYTRDGMHNAAAYISQQFASFGLQPMAGTSFQQIFSFSANTFPAAMAVSVNGKKLAPGVDFIVSPESRGVHAKGNLEQQDSTHFVDAANRIIVSLEDKLTWSVEQEQADYTMVQVDKKALGEAPQTIEADIDNKLVKNFKAANVCGWVKGTVKPDSIIVISAHYDHLGGMGADTYFPGANDNASGTSLLLGLAKYYGADPQPYTMAFLSFAAEEAGLVGSKYFAEHPLVPLKQIRFLINLDLEGTGSEGITVVNASEFPQEFAMLNEVNNSDRLLSKINSRGKAANSDHYWFTEKGVPAFFLYTLGGIKAYHDVFDKAQTLPLNEYENLFKLLIGFNQKLMR